MWMSTTSSTVGEHKKFGLPGCVDKIPDQVSYFSDRPLCDAFTDTVAGGTCSSRWNAEKNWFLK